MERPWTVRGVYMGVHGVPMGCLQSVRGASRDRIVCGVVVGTAFGACGQSVDSPNRHPVHCPWTVRGLSGDCPSGVRGSFVDSPTGFHG